MEFPRLDPRLKDQRHMIGPRLKKIRRLGTPLPLAALVNEFYKEVQAMGGGRWDTSSLLRRLQKRRG